MIRALVVSLEDGSELRVKRELGADVVAVSVAGGIAELDAGAARIIGRALLELAVELEQAAAIRDAVTAPPLGELADFPRDAQSAMRGRLP